jgi:hypothetical protein
MDKPDKLATLGTQDIGQRKTKHTHITSQKTKMMRYTDPSKKTGVNSSARETLL